ncbi:MAG: hypothetical protein PGN08_12625 [Sphingomonas taxi]
MPSFFDTGHIRWCSCLFVAALIAAFTFGLVTVWSAVLTMFLLLLAVPAWLILVIAGGGILSWHGLKDGARLHGGQRIATMLAAPLLAVATLALAVPAHFVGTHVGWLSKLAVNYWHYGAIVRDAEIRVARGARDCCTSPDGELVYIDPGPPVRAAFDPQGLLDNWSGIVFDPSGDVMLAKGFNPITGTFAAPERITKLFGGDLVGCRPLVGHYYVCSFT